MKKQREPSSSTRPSVPAPESATSQERRESPKLDSSPTSPLTGSELRHALENSVPVQIQDFGVTVWEPSMSQEESERRTREVVMAFKAVRKPGMSKEELDRAMHEELVRRGLLPNAASK
jgi:hypothetical protein